jgi:hypothetical protein
MAGVTRKVLLQPHEVVVGKMQSNRRLQVFKLLAESVGQRRLESESSEYDSEESCLLAVEHLHPNHASGKKQARGEPRTCSIITPGPSER